MSCPCYGFVCVCVTPRFELCKLFIAWRWKASWSLSGLLHRPQTHNIVLPPFFPPIITDTRYRSLIYIKRHIWMCRAFYLWLGSSFPCLSACSHCLFSPLRSDAYRHTHTHTPFDWSKCERQSISLMSFEQTLHVSTPIGVLVPVEDKDTVHTCIYDIYGVMRVWETETVTNLSYFSCI